MTHEEYLKSVRDMTYLICCVMNDITPEKNVIDSISLPNLFKASERHFLTAITAMALEKAGIQDYDFTQALGNAIKKNGTLDIEMRRMFKLLEENAIWYMPLKGAVLKDYYPKFGMRQMSDIDVLFDSQCAEKVRELFEACGYTTEEFGNGHHDTYFKLPVSNFEMHTDLFGVGHSDVFNVYYDNVKSRLIKDDGNSYGYHFSNEDFYIFMLAHEYKHYKMGGTGLRSVLDAFVFLRKFDGRLDMGYIDSELKKIGVDEFEKNQRQLAFDLFGNNTITPEHTEMYNYIVDSGTYGTFENNIANRVEATGSTGAVGKAKYLWQRFFPSDEALKLVYPEFYEHKWKRPFLHIYRFSKMIGIRRKSFAHEFSVLMKVKK